MLTISGINLVTNVIKVTFYLVNSTSRLRFGILGYEDIMILGSLFQCNIELSLTRCKTVNNR